MKSIFMKYIKTFENFSNENNDIFNQYPTDLRNRLPWKGFLSENDKFSKFFFYSDSESSDEARERAPKYLRSKLKRNETYVRPHERGV